MNNTEKKYPQKISRNRRLYKDSQGNHRPYKPYKPHTPRIPIDAREKALIEHVESVLAALPPYAALEKDAIQQNHIVDISEHLSLPENYIAFLENDTTPIRKPEDKPTQNSSIYNRENWRLRVGHFEDIIKRWIMGLAVSMAICDRFGDTIRQRTLWYGSGGIPLDIDEFKDGTEQKSHRPQPCYSMDDFLQQYPKIKEVACYLIPSSRSLWKGRPFKSRALVPFEIPVWDYRVFQRIAQKLNQMFGFLPNGVTKNGVASAFGAAHNAPQARHFNGCISRDFIQECANEVKQQVKQQKQLRQDTMNARDAARKKQETRKTKLKARGYDIQQTTSPIEAFMAAVNPIEFMVSQGWLTLLSGNEYHWHESGDGKSCEIETDNTGQVVIKPFSNSMQAASPNADETKPVGGHRFLLYILYGLDVNNEQDKKQLRKRLAEDGYGTHPEEYHKIKAAEQKAVRDEGVDDPSTTDRPTNPNDEQFIKSILENTLDIPEVEDTDTPAYKHWTPEQRLLCEKTIGRNPDEGWHENTAGIWTPAMTTKYQNLYQMTNIQAFQGNTPIKEIEKGRIFSTQPGVCPKCYGVTALSIDKVKLTAHQSCPKCQTDTQIGSYQNHELKRKVKNAVISEYQGFLGDNPDFQSFELFRKERLTYLGAAMATGKTTEIAKKIVHFVRTENKRGIICVPRTSLARAIAYTFRQKHGYNAWGLWHEGSGNQNQFIGTHGAIVCLPSLNRAVTEAKEQGVGIEDLLIAIDEVDFSYQLLSLAIATKLKTKQILQDAVHTNGLLVAGQTESTLALEAFAAELGLHPEDINGFYNTAAPADGYVEVRTYPDVEDKTDFARADAIEYIHQLLQIGKNAYVFCNERRDIAMLAEIFNAYNPVLYTAYHKGDKRADAVLYNQKVTDTQLFLATSSAGVGINIHDPNAETVIIAGAHYGQRDIAIIIQEALRNRARRKVTICLPPITTSQPISPTEAENVSLYEQGLKILGKPKYKALPEDAIKRLARSTALATLANNDPMTCFRHHLQVAGMKLVEKQVELETIPDHKQVKEIRAKTRSDERDAVTKRISELLNAPKLHILTSTQIRADGTAGKMTPMPVEQLAQERINHAAQALGYNDTETENFDFIDTQLLKELCLTISDYQQLNQQRKGWMHIHHNEWVHQQFEQHLKQNQHEDGLTAEEGALEITDIEDTRTAGTLLTQLIDTLKGKTWTQTTLAQTVKEILKYRHGNDTFMTLMQNGALGVTGYKASRFFHIASDEDVVQWTRNFVEQWYPVRIAKNKETYYLTPQANAELKKKVFQRWFAVKNGTPDDDSDGHPPPFIDEFCEPLDPRSEQKARARQLVNDGIPPKVAAEKTKLPYNLVCEITRDIRDTEKIKQRETAIKLFNDGAALKDIATQLNVSQKTIKRWCDAVQGESHIVDTLHDTIAVRTRNWNFTVDPVQHVTLQHQIFHALSTGEKTTRDMLKRVDGNPTSIKNQLKSLVDDKQIIKRQHGVYALPQATHEIEQPQPEPVSVEPVGKLPPNEQLNEQTEKDLWFAIYLIQQALLDKRMRTRDAIAAQANLPQDACDAALNFMYQQVLVNCGVGDTFWMDHAARQRCMDYVLTVAQLPYLLLYVYLMTQHPTTGRGVTEQRQLCTCVATKIAEIRQNVKGRYKPLHTNQPHSQHKAAPT